MLEVIATCIDDVLKIAEGGGQRIELVSALTEGGVTPSRALTAQAVRCANNLPVMVMIRPHAQSFVYSREDLSVMTEDLKIALDCGAAGVVLGALTPKRELDRRALDALFSVPLQGRSVTFHKALDLAVDIESAFTQLLDYPVNRVLTAGGPGNILDNLKTLRKLSCLGNDKIAVMAGGGIKLDNTVTVMDATGLQEIHVGTAVRRSASCLQPIDPLLVRQFSALCG